MQLQLEFKISLSHILLPINLEGLHLVLYLQF